MGPPLNGSEAAFEVATVGQEVVQMEEILQTKQIQKLPSPPKPPVAVYRGCFPIRSCSPSLTPLDLPLNHNALCR